MKRLLLDTLVRFERVICRETGLHGYSDRELFSKQFSKGPPPPFCFSCWIHLGRGFPAT